MKKAILILILAAGGYQLKAQQLFKFNPADSLLNNNPKNFKITPGNPSLLFKPGVNLNSPFNNLLTKNTISSVDHMPIAVLNGYSKMPVAKIGGYYTMPVAKPGINDRFPVSQNALPGVPPLKDIGK